MSFSGRKTYRLGEIATFYNGRAYKNEEFLMSGTPIVRIQNLTGEGKTVYSDLNLEPNKYIDKGDLIYAWSATFGPYLWKGEKSIYHYHIWKIECKENLLDKHYFYYTLKHISDRLKSGGNGTLFVHITKGFMESFEIDIPNISIQRKTASILSSLDDAIELNQQINKTLEEMAKAIFREWFVDFNFPNATGKFQETEIGKIPVGWKVYTFGDLIDTVSETYRFGKKEKIIFLNTGDILDGEFLHRNYSEIASLPGQAKKSIKQNDILFSEIRPANKRFAFVNFDADEYVVSTKLMVLRSKGINPRLIYFLLTREEMLKQLQHLAESRSGTFPQITFSQLKDLKVALPQDETLESFVKILEAYYNQSEQNIEENQSLINLRDTLLPKLMKGEIEINSKADVAKV